MLPARLASRLEAVLESLTFTAAPAETAVPESAVLLAVGDAVLTVVAETSAVPLPFIRAALAYWADYPEEVDAFLDRARAEAAQAEAGWERQQDLLAASGERGGTRCRRQARRAPAR